ncbi:hypothetical protein BG011_001692 [Mortierella polycephala]|uniref:Galactose oxidase n=1 Tax=Mortierella polycephala TaxID=41804 RepID=A0A9P6U5K5_9FUNG|nr:hypothetical protein BG011_001692 [Mortierella polycephala]
MAIFHVASVLFILAAIVCAQPQSEPARETRAITLIGSDIYLYGGSGSSGTCFSDLYNLHLDSANGWVSGTAPWKSVDLEGSPTLAVGSNSWAVGSTDGTKMLVYGQTLCPQQLAKDSASPHSFNASSGSIEFGFEDDHWKPLSTEMDVLGPRQVKNDEPVPVQVVDHQNHIVYTFVYDAFNPQLGMQLWSFPADNPPSNIAQSAKNTTMPTAQPPRLPLTPPAATNGTNGTIEQVPSPSSTVLAPFVDAGAAVYHNGAIIVVGGGRATGLNLTGEDMDGDSGYYKMDRCWIYTIASNEWSVRSLTAQGGNFPLPRRLAALLVVDNKIYMHGGNTTQTVPTDTYAKDFWILDTQTWEWTAGPESQSGRASHTLVHYDSRLLSISGFEFETSKSKAARNAFVMVYDMDSLSWGSQFGTINKSYFQQHAVAIIGGSVAAFIALLVLASIASRLWRKYTLKSSGGAAGLKRKKRPSKPFLATTATAKSVPMATTTSASHPVAATRLSGMTLNNQNPGLRAHETQIDLSALPRTSDSTAYESPSHNQQFPSQYQHAHQQQYNPYASTQQQQQVPLMSANVLEQQDDEPEPYADDEPEKDSHPRFQSPPDGVGPGFP